MRPILALAILVSLSQIPAAMSFALLSLSRALPAFATIPRTTATTTLRCLVTSSSSSPLHPPPQIHPDLVDRVPEHTVTSHSKLYVPSSGSAQLLPLPLLLEVPPVSPARRSSSRSSNISNSDDLSKNLQWPTPEQLALLPSPPPAMPSVTSLTSAIEAAIPLILDILALPQYTVDVHLQSLELIREANLDNRGVDAYTDVLSYPFVDYLPPATKNLKHYLPFSYTTTRGKLPPPPHTIDGEFDRDYGETYLCLGEMEMCVDYVYYVMLWDMIAAASSSGKGGKGGNPIAGSNPITNNYDDWSTDGGVSLAMSKSNDVTTRCKLLLVHSMVHLLGYDHENDADKKQMEEVEEWVLEKLKERGGL
jgi:ssRNA-specific RNase YbeY (16S rRNA maturation enzyme)